MQWCGEIGEPLAALRVLCKTDNDVFVRAILDQSTVGVKLLCRGIDTQFDPFMFDQLMRIG